MEEDETPRSAGNRKRRTTSPRHRLPWPPFTYREWLESVEESDRSKVERELGDEERKTLAKATIGGKKNAPTDWPYHPHHLDVLIEPEGKLDGEQCLLLGTVEDIKNDLKKHATYDTKVLDSVEERLQKLEKTLQDWSVWFLDPNPRLKRPQKIFMTDLNEEVLASRRLQAEQADLHQKLDPTSLEDQKGSNRTVDILKFPGLHKAGRCVPLPGKLEALSILNIVTKCANIPPRVMKPWKRVFFCNTSSSILQNTFWWMWMDRFKPSPHWQGLLFDNVADDFSLLLGDMTGNTGDTVFMLYPTCLAQALYCCFCQAFPGSLEQINDPEFLEFISNTTSEWIKGVRSDPEAWKAWPRNLLAPNTVHMLSDRETPSAGGWILNSPYSSPHKTVSILSSAKSSGRNMSLTDIVVEQGPSFERVQFKTAGQSPLLAHCLRKHQLTNKDKASSLISRTQVKELPPQGTSLDNLLQCYKQQSDERLKQYDGAMNEYEHSIAADRKRLLRKLRKSNMKKEQLLQNKHEVSQMAFEIGQRQAKD